LSSSSFDRHLEPDEDLLFPLETVTSKKSPELRRREHLVYLRSVVLWYCDDAVAVEMMIMMIVMMMSSCPHVAQAIKCDSGCEEHIFIILTVCALTHSLLFHFVHVPTFLPTSPPLFSDPS
jgi:hypothetical protein